MKKRGIEIDMTRLTYKDERVYGGYLAKDTDEFACVGKLGQLEDIMEKYDINSAEELERVILNEVTGEQSFKDYVEVYVKPYKDIEEELGIDLITLFEILKSENIYANGKRYDNSNSLSYMGNSWLIFNHQAKQGFRFKDYGKTWALTKEELE